MPWPAGRVGSQFPLPEIEFLANGDDTRIASKWRHLGFDEEPAYTVRFADRHTLQGFNRPRAV